MSEIQVEVCFTDKLESVRVGGKAMEIPKAVKAKPVEEWFEPAAGRVKWGGLGAEIKEMDFSNEKNAVYSFLFIGPEDKKQEFMECVERFCLGEEAQQETKRRLCRTTCRRLRKISRPAMPKWRSSSTWSRPEITEAPRHSLKWPGAIRTARAWKKRRKCGRVV